jgi:formylglycine-generating enzyme required for sulfatase activity
MAILIHSVSAKTVRRNLIAAAAGTALAAVFAVGFHRQVPNASAVAREQARTPTGMVHVPGGWCRIGSDDPDAEDDVRPSRSVFVGSFYLDRTEVTNAEFQRFRPEHVFPAGEEDLPVSNVRYEEAAAYAQWAGKRLPTELEWEKAARGTDGRRYPWGDQWDPGRVAPRSRTVAPALVPERKKPGTCVSRPSRLVRVGSRPAGASPYGCLDMAGNAWEWVQGFYQGNRAQRIIRGGAVSYGERACRTYSRGIEGAGVT